MSRQLTVEVNLDHFGDFTDKLLELELDNTISGKDGDQISVNIIFEKEDSAQVDILEDYLEALLAKIKYLKYVVSFDLF